MRRLAADVTAAAATTYDKVLALEGWMAEHTRYRLDIPPLPAGADATDQFLFVDREGFCEQIGTSLVVMLHSLGIPARLVAGYVPGERNPFTGLYEVRGRDAHAWTKVYLPGIGWQGCDRTAAEPPSTGLGPASSPTSPTTFPVFRLGWSCRRSRPCWWPAASWRREDSRARGRVPRSWAEAWTELEQAGARHGHWRRPSETLMEYASALGRSPLAHPRLADAAAIVTRASFSGTSVSEADRALAGRVLEDLRNPGGSSVEASRSPTRRGRRPFPRSAG